MRLTLSNLSLFLFIGMHLCVESYKRFRLEPMHVIFFDVGKMQKECLAEILSDLQKTSSFVNNYHMKNKTYKQVKRRVLSCLEYFLKVNGQINSGSSFCHDLLRGSDGSFLTGFFAENSIMKLLEDSDYESID